LVTLLSTVSEETMSTYDLVCDACGHEFEVFVQGFIKDAEKVCPDCGSVDVRQKFSSFLRSLGGRSSSDCAPTRSSGFG
jgi:putative FmdB family regulatory protein